MIAHQKSSSVQITQEDLTGMQSDLATCFSRLDDPFASVLTLLMALYRKASTENHRVVLDGVEGDLVVSLTRDYLPGLIRERKWQSAISELNATLSNNLTDLSTGRFVSGTLRAGLTPAWLERLRFSARGTQTVTNELQNSLLSKNMIATPGLKKRYRSYLKARVAPYRTLTEQHLWWLRQPFIAVALERYDRVAGVCGIEPRHPLLDKRIVEFCLALPWQLKINGGWSKWILRQSMHAHLPQSIVWRKDKPNLGQDFNARWMSNNWPEFQATINATAPIWSVYADRRSVLPYFEPQTYNSTTTPESDPFDMYFLATWLKKFH